MDSNNGITIKTSEEKQYTLENSFGMTEYIDEKGLHESLVKSAYDMPNEKYRKPLPNIGFTYPYQDFVSLSRISKYTKKVIKFKTYCNYNKELTSFKGVVFFTHGFSTYSVVNAHVAQRLADDGFIVCSYDLREHGLTEEDLGYIYDLEEVIEDCVEFVKLAEIFVFENFKAKLPKFLVGNSMGGLINYFLSQKADFRGVVYITPCFNVPATTLSRYLASTFSFFYPYKLLAKPTISENCKNPQIMENTDEVTKRPQMMGTINAIIYLIDKFYKEEKKYHEKSMLIIAAGVEKLVYNDDTFKYFNNSTLRDKTFWFYPNMWHNAYMEEEIYDIMPRLSKWLSDRVSK